MPVSRPFDKPKTGKIAVKVINHYGMRSRRWTKFPNEECGKRSESRWLSYGRSVQPMR